MTYKPPDEQHDQGSALVANWTAKNRAASKEFLLSNTSANGANRPTPREHSVFEAFGSPLAMIMKDVLKRWHKSMKCKLAMQEMQDKNTFQPIRTEEHVQLIMSYLGTYHQMYESVFGLIEEQKHPNDDQEHCKVRIRSTGFAAKVFLGIIMADRLWAIVQKRKVERASQGFVHVDLEELEQDGRDCPICCDELGVQNPEGVEEKPIRLVICCQQVFGEKCLKLWLKENWKSFDRDTCPNCRFKFPESFLEKLLQNERSKKDENDENSDDEGSETEREEDVGDSESSGEEGTDTSASSSPEVPVEPDQVDTPMSNTQADTDEVSEGLITSVEREDEFMIEG